MKNVKSRAKTPKRTEGRNFKTRISTVELDARQLNELLKTYLKMGTLLEQLVGRERIYQPEFLKGLDQALRDASAGRTEEVRTLDEFVA